MESLEENDIKDVGDELILELETSEYEFFYDAIKLIVKTFKRKGYDVKIPSFKTNVDDDGVISYVYKWELKKSEKDENLPF